MDTDDGPDNENRWADAETRWPGGIDGLAKRLLIMAKHNDLLTVGERRACAVAAHHLTSVQESAYLYSILNQIFMATLPHGDEEPTTSHVLAAKGIEFSDGQHPCEQRGGCMYREPGGGERYRQDG